MLTGLENITFFAEAVEKAANQERIQQVLTSVSLWDDRDVQVKKYSKGMLQRLGLAITLYQGDLVTCQGFECMAEILARFSKIGVSAGEYPLILRYNLKKGKSKMKVIRTIMGYFKLLKKVKRPLLH